MSFDSFVEVGGLTDIIFAGYFIFEDINPVRHLD